jgi:hypothetical protein
MTGELQPVVVGLSGGLGNQMFQYAAGRSLAVRLGLPLVLDLSWFGGQMDRQFALSPFRIDALQRTQCAWLPLRGQALTSRLSRRWLPRIGAGFPRGLLAKRALFRRNSIPAGTRVRSA